MQIENEDTLIYKLASDHESVFDAFIDELGLSARFFKSLVKENSISLNGKAIKRKTKVKRGDTIIINMLDEKPVYQPQNMSLEVLYEDLDLLIINKPPFTLVHPTKTHSNNTISNGVANYFVKKNIRKKVRLINRLDMNTSGVLVISKNPFGHLKLAAQMEKDIVKKKYIAVVEGVVEKDSDIIDLPIGKDDDNPIKNKVTSTGKKCITKYTVIKRYKTATLLEVNIMTGRTHQIRVHLAHIGYPIIGDELYNKECKLIKRQALHAYEIKFLKPRSNELISICAKYPDDILNLLREIDEE